MTVGFFHRGGPSACLDAALASVRRAMPGVPIQILRDDGGPLALAVLQAYAYAGEGEWLFLDTDTIVQRDVQHVCEERFDVAVATRAGTLRAKEVGSRFMARMPYNKGAVFSRCRFFWNDAAQWLAHQSDRRQAWMGDQLAMNAIIERKQYDVRVLPNAYNYPPRTDDEDVRGMYILHLKGPRKAWLHRFAA